MSPALGTNGGRSKNTPVFMHFCIECNGKSVKFDTIAKIKVTSVLEVFLSLRYVMYIIMICEKKRNKNRGSPFIEENGGRSKSKNWRQNAVFVKIANIKKILCKI